jgi:hypothetical protein
VESGRSKRTLARLRRLEKLTPPEVQRAVDAGDLPLTVAEKVVKLPAEAKEEIARQIRQGGNAKEVVRQALAGLPKRPPNAQAEKDRLIRTLKKGLEALQGREHEVWEVTPDDETVLRDSPQLFTKLLVRAHALKKRQGKTDKALAEATEKATKLLGPRHGR